VAYIDDDDEDDPSMPLYQTMPYACGKVLLASVLDSLVAAVCVEDYSQLFPKANLILALTLCPIPKPNPNSFSNLALILTVTLTQL